MKVKEINEIHFEDEVLNSKGVVVIKFYGNWCGPCKMVASVLEQMADIEGLKLLSMDVDKNLTIAKHFGVMSVPTFLIFKNGGLVDKVTGFRNQKQLSELFNSYVDSSK